MMLGSSFYIFSKNSGNHDLAFNATLRTSVSGIH